MRIEFHEPNWQITATPDVMIRLKHIFPRANKYRTGALHLASTPEVCRDLEWIMERWEFDIPPGDLRRLSGGADQHRATQEEVRSILNSGQALRLDGMEPARAPREYQRVAADLALTTGHLLLADDLGLGKSMSSLLMLRDPEALPALIVCPTHLPEQWVSELGKTFPLLRTHIIRSLKVYDPAERREMGGHNPDVLIINYAKLRGWGDHLAGQVKTVIFDEVQELRRADSDKYVAAAQIADGATYKMGLSATPVYNYGGETHNIFQVLAPEVLGSREEFAREWGSGYWHDQVEVADPAALGTYLRNEGLLLRRTRKDVGRELPEVVRVTHAIDSDEKVYDKLTGEAIDLAKLILNSEAERKERWQASGELDWRLRQATGIAKAPYVADFTRLLLESEESVVLFGWHRAVYDIWAERLADFDPVFYTGEESPAAKQRSRDEFVSGRSRVLIMSLRAGLGLDGLQERSHVAVFGELDWSPGMHDQCVGRLHRDGQGESVVAYFLVSETGADPPMAEVLNLKRMQSEPLIDPEAELFTAADRTGRIRQLAEEVMRQRQARPQQQLVAA